ncbi:hypothetical protein J3R30DRAFT_3694987 [Lentinula aciculospora]|uniref:F-box domain-containing protein n=1 Tax=Lentinula aciculospora TaxID=153920 RepID=A0A9W9AUM2_9AGAR|nr:hypothetical protein J3R30DRAFT_3694987 [Lentinula aciculospora]
MDWLQIPQLSLSLCEMCDNHLFLPSRTSIDPQSSLLHGNHSLSDLEREQALRSISEAEDDITLLDDSLTRIRRVLELIQAYRDKRNCHRHNCKALLMPTRCIPNEIWMQILPAAIQGTATDFHLLQVCRHWRLLLGSIPLMFDRVQLDLTDPLVNPQKITRFLIEYSTRLHGVIVPQIDIVLPQPWIYYRSLESYNQVSDGFILSLKNHLEYIASRSWWGQMVTHLRLFNFSTPWEQLFWNSSFQAPSCLKHLTIKLHSGSALEGEYCRLDHVLSPFKKCNVLRYVTIPNGWIDFQDGFSEIQVVHLTNTDAVEAMHILQKHSETLTSVTIQSVRTGRWSNAENISLPQLQHLIIEAENYDINEILGRLTCPELISLHLCGVLDWEVVHQFIIRSACSLQRFAIGASSTSSDRENLDYIGLLDVLRSSPSIRQLTYFEPSHAIQHENYYSGYHMSNTVLTALAYSDSTTSVPYILPQLEHLITYCPSSQLGVVLAMAESRIQGGIFKHLGVHLLEVRPVETQSIVQYYSLNMTTEEFGMKVAGLTRQNVGAYRILTSPGIIRTH